MKTLVKILLLMFATIFVVSGCGGSSSGDKTGKMIIKSIELK